MNMENLLNTDNERHTLITQKSTLPMVDLIVVIGICFFIFCEGGNLYAKSKSRMDTRYS